MRLTTANLGASASEYATLAFKSARVMKVATDRPARLRLYPTDAARLADLARGIGIDPAGDAAVLLDVVTAVGLLTVHLSPVSAAYNDDGPVQATIYVTITNQDAAPGVINADFTLAQTE